MGSVLTYHCGPEKYPSPVSYRTCEEHGEWSPMRLASGRLASRATCKGNVDDDDAFGIIHTWKRSHSGVHIHLPLTQTCCVRLSCSWIMVTSGPGTSGLLLGWHRASPARKASPCMAQLRETALSLGSGREKLPSVTTMVRKEEIKKQIFLYESYNFKELHLRLHGSSSSLSHLLMLQFTLQW